MTGRRAAFRTQKWSHSFDQTSASPSLAVSRRQHHQPLSLDSGYPGSPSSGLASYQSQTWTETNNNNISSSTAPNIETAKRELAGLMRDSGCVSLPASSGSLPSFPDIFQSPPTCLQSTNFYSYPACHESLGTQEDLDELDKEITEIVEQAAASGGLLREISEENVCLKPRPIKTNSILLSPGGHGESPSDVMGEQPGGQTEESHYYSSSVTTSTNLYPSCSVSASPTSPALPLVVTETPANQPAGFKRTAQFSSECLLLS